MEVFQITEMIQTMTGYVTLLMLSKQWKEAMLSRQHVPSPVPQLIVSHGGGDCARPVQMESTRDHHLLQMAVGDVADTSLIGRMGFGRELKQLHYPDAICDGVACQRAVLFTSG